MDEKKITEREGIEIITSMIARTRERYVGDGNILLMWGYLTVIVTVLVWITLVSTQNHAWNWLWFLIPVVGGIATPIMSRKQQLKSGVKSYTDKLTSKIWTIVGVASAVAVLCCLGFALFKGINCWLMMFLFPVIVIPVVEMAQGFIVKENSLVFGGAIGLAIGLFMTCCVVGKVALYHYWALPLFIVAFICMMIIPGHIINHKKKSQR